jgi:hypothetical protein
LGGPYYDPYFYKKDAANPEAAAQVDAAPVADIAPEA